MSMITVREAHERLRSNNRVWVADESADLKACLGRVLAADIVSAIDVPPADNSAMDGYALRRADWIGADHALEISQRITAGKAPAPLEAGTAARIFTGAEIPPGADVVVMQEKCRTDGKPRVHGERRRNRCQHTAKRPGYQPGCDGTYRLATVCAHRTSV